MHAADFLSKCLLLDLEARGDRIYRIGALLDDEPFLRKGRFRLEEALTELDAFADRAACVVGHNLLDHDIPILFRNLPRLRLLQKPVVDTLFLSPLAFPENPYHRLVKDYKLVRDSLNDPVADARLAGSVFVDQWESFASSLAGGMGDVLSVHRFCFDNQSFGGALCRQGFADVFQALGVERIEGSRVLPTLEAKFSDRLCRKALAELVPAALSSSEGKMALAYCTAWLQVAGSNSVLPPWVRRRFPAVVDMLRRLRETPCTDPGCDYCRAVHDPVAQLKRYFGFPTFRPAPVFPGDGFGLQEAIVRHGMAEQPLLAILPTGGGKSLCFQLPALVRHFRRGTLTVVISPLQALMKDQVDNITAKTGSPSAAALYGLLTPPERGEVLERVRLGDVAILYVAPEQLRNKSFRKAIAQREIGCWVFDEAHCLSKWGHDFRPDYLYAGRFIREFSDEQGAPVAPVACFTATAKPDVKQEITDYFKRELEQTLTLFEAGVERDNLHFEVQMVTQSEKLARIHDVLSERLPEATGSAVVYAATRRRAEEAAEYLRMQNWSAAAYHGGLSAPEKRAVQEAFLQGDIRVICATNAFGMGIDKEDIRLVLHAEIPGSLENYLQEAGRAGRDLQDAECVLLYDERDIETQFSLEALSELSQRDIAELLRGLRRARRNERGEVVITAGELLRDETVEPGFDTSDPQADTKVKSAVAWLERAGFIQRNQNETRVFQGKPIVRSLTEARSRIAALNLPQSKQECWMAILEALINADPDEGLSADELAELPVLKRLHPTTAGPSHRDEETDTQRVLRMLHEMAESGLIKRGLLLTAFVRYKVSNPSQLTFDRVCALETSMLKAMQEAAPDAAAEGWLDLSLRRLNQRMLDGGFADSSPQVLLKLLKSLGMDGRGLAGNRGSIELRQVSRDQHRIKLQRDWDALTATAERRRAVAKVVLDTILARIPADAAPSAELLVAFSSDDVLQALQTNIYLAGKIKDPLAAIDRGLMFLHEQRVITLQQGLAVFRQAMTIRVLPQPPRRRYAKTDYEPLYWHYKERTLQIHVMHEYARLGAEKIRQALELVLAYFSMDKVAFVKRFFAGRREILDRATGQESYRRIVEDLHNLRQTEVVTAPDDTNMLILAGPGSGKTRTVVHRCAYLLQVKRAPARSILILCFNRNAAVSLRRRLLDLVGAASKGVTIQTYHSLAMRLSGISFAELTERGAGEPPRFDHLIPEATQLLRGERELLGLEADELRERLLAGYRYILVDEYQDIDREQYDLISALAGRTEKDRDRKLAILAVGDDDQNIYTFRGANVEFIRRFRDDYHAATHYLVENYRSTAHIIAAANQLIEHNRDRMKTERAIRIDAAREGEPPGGAWAERDPLGMGRVQIIRAAGVAEQAGALVAELIRLQRLSPHGEWSDFAVLARTHPALAPIRAVCEHHAIPVMQAIPREHAPPLHRVREIAQFLDALKSCRERLARASEIQALLDECRGTQAPNPWHRRMQDLLRAWRDETADSTLPVSHFVEYLHEALAEQRRDQLLGDGVLLGTVHAAKGMEFLHVLLPDDGWLPAATAQSVEEERRLFYVAMTRARQTLCLFERAAAKNPHVKLLSGEHILRRPGGTGVDVPGDAADRLYELLGMREMYLSFASRFPESHRIHRSLAALRPGSRLGICPRGERIELLDEEGCAVAMLSHAAARVWLSRIASIRDARVVGMIRREAADSEEDFKRRCQVGRWEIPWVEVVYSR